MHKKDPILDGHMKIIYTLLFVMGLAFSAQGQQWPQYSLYSWNPFAFNPAYAGLDGSLSFTGAFRKQWMGLEGSPLSQQANLHMPLHILNSGVGLYLSNDQLGAEHTIGVGAAYSFHFEIGSKATLSAGVSGQWLQYTLDGSILRTPEGSYEGGNIDHNDVALPEGRFTAATQTLGAGLYLQHPRYKFGVSVQNALEPSLSKNDISFTLDRAILATAGTRVGLGRYWYWEPSVLVKTNTRQMQVDWTNILVYDGNFFGGFAFRGYDRLSVDAAVVLAGVRINEKLFIGYAYDFSVSSLRQVNDGSHEIVLRYQLPKVLGKDRIPPIIYSPRF